LDPTIISHYTVYTSQQTLVTEQDSPSMKQNSQGNTLSLRPSKMSPNLESKIEDLTISYSIHLISPHIIAPEYHWQVFHPLPCSKV